MNKKGYVVPLVILIVAAAVVGFLVYKGRVANKISPSGDIVHSVPASTSGANQTSTAQESAQVASCDANCFIQAASSCSSTSATITVKQPIDLALVNFTEKMEINGAQSGKCLFKTHQDSVKVELNPEAFQAMKAQADAYLAKGSITQKQYESGLRDIQDVSKTQKFWDTQIGVSYDCKIPNSQLVSILKSWILPHAWSPTTTINFSMDGLNAYCKIIAPNVK